MDRRTLLLSIVLAILVVALGVVGVLVLRRRSVLQIPTVTSQPAEQRKLPTDTKPYASLKKVEPWKPGDPVPTSMDVPTYLPPSQPAPPPSP